MGILFPMNTIPDFSAISITISIKHYALYNTTLHLKAIKESSVKLKFERKKTRQFTRKKARFFSSTLKKFYAVCLLNTRLSGKRFQSLNIELTCKSDRIAPHSHL